MDGYEATRIVFPRIQKLDPENASKIMNLLLSQDNGEKEMIRLASGPESLVHSMIVKARKDLGLPSNSPSPFLLPALTVYEPHNPMRPNNNLVMRKAVINPDGFLGLKHIEEIADETNPAASLDTTQPPNTTADDFEDLEDLTFTVSTVSQLRLLPPKLRILTIEGCVYLEALPHDFLGRIPTLQEFYLISCPSLRSFHYSASLTTLYICDCISFEFPPSLEHKHPSLHRLYIGRSCVSLTTLPLDLFSELKTICIWNCLNLTSFDFTGEFRGTLESLEILEIRDCPRLSSFPDKGLNAPNLTSIVLSNCTDLNKLPNSMNSLTSLKTLILRGCPEIQSFPCGGLPSSLFFLTIIDCDKLTPQEDWGLHRLESLRRFVLQGGCMGMESFPEEKLLPSNIITLCISKLQSLKKLDYKGFQHLKSLHKLEIHCCDILRSLPEQRLPSSLKFLHVQECPLLTESLKPERGKEWHKVAHIPYLQIDDLVLSSDNWSVKAI